MTLNFKQFLETIPMMAMGMGGVLAITAVLIIVMLLLTKIFKK